MSYRWIVAAAFLPSLILTMGACTSTSSETGFLLRIVLDEKLGIDQFRLLLEADDDPTWRRQRQVPEGPIKQQSGTTILAILPEDLDGKTIKLTVSGLASGRDKAKRSVGAIVKRGEFVPVEVELSSACPDACLPGERQCEGDAALLCEEDGKGCTRWKSETCPTDIPYCSFGLCEAQCRDECGTDERRCLDDNSFRICGQHDSDSCLEWGPQLSCSSSEQCAEGKCLTDCGGQPCPCQPDCSERTCGNDEKCGISCGSCGANETCNPEGQCEKKQLCILEGPTVVDDTLQHISMGWNDGACISLGLDHAGKVHISYTDSYYLQYATNSSGKWVLSNLDEYSRESSIAVDGAGGIHIAFYHDTATGLAYAAGAPGAWDIKLIDDPPEAVGMYVSLALDLAGKAHISYLDYGNKNLKYATNVSGAWDIKTLDYQGEVGEFSSLAVDSRGKVHISYWDRSSTALKYATNASGSWEIQTIDDSCSDLCQTSIATDSSNKVHISYGNPHLMYATNTSGSWAVETIDWKSSLGYSGDNTSIAVDSGDKVHLSYYAGFYNGFKYATQASGHWTINHLETIGDVGQYNSLKIDSAGAIHIAYEAESSKLKYLKLCP